jgi:hypothetical protein
MGEQGERTSVGRGWSSVATAEKAGPDAHPEPLVPTHQWPAVRRECVVLTDKRAETGVESTVAVVGRGTRITVAGLGAANVTLPLRRG